MKFKSTLGEFNVNLKDNNLELEYKTLDKLSVFFEVYEIKVEEGIVKNKQVEFSTLLTQSDGTTEKSSRKTPDTFWGVCNDSVICAAVYQGDQSCKDYVKAQIQDEKDKTLRASLFSGCSGLR